MELGPNQKAWLEALRSGEFEQGKEVLCFNNKYCCLGVGAVVLQRLGYDVDITPYIDDAGQKTNLLKFNDNYETLTDELAMALGLNNEIGEAINKETGENPEGLAECTVMNDNHELSFTEIADILEANAEFYFTGPM